MRAQGILGRLDAPQRRLLLVRHAADCAGWLADDVQHTLQATLGSSVREFVAVNSARVAQVVARVPRPMWLHADYCCSLTHGLDWFVGVSSSADGRRGGAQRGK
jgi:hypothetical protein